MTGTIEDIGYRFDPNDGGPPTDESFRLPRIREAFTVETYADFFTNLPSPIERWAQEVTREVETHQSVIKSDPMAMQKAIGVPPQFLSFAKFALLPETYNAGVLQWPGIAPAVLRKIARENFAPQAIISMRVDDVLNYSVRSTHPWKPGWEIKLREGFDVPDKELSKDIEDCQTFLEGCNNEKLTARQRDKLQLQDFPTFLGSLVRDSLTYDGMAVWTQMTLGGTVKAFKAMSSYNMRRCLPTGYRGDPEIFCVGVDDAGNVQHTFTRDQLIFRHRNNRPDDDIMGYGYPEIEQTMKLIAAFQNAMDMNADVFTRNSTPNGFLVVKGGMNQKQLDILSRIWINLKRGITKSWALPVIPVPKDGDIEVKDLSHLKEMDVYYSDFMNMVAGLFCAMYRFPVRRLGYHISGKTNDNKPPETPTTTAPGIEDYDPYIGVLLAHIENLINPYLVWTNWPHLQFGFTAKNPKEDARAYEARVLACTVDERRALSDEPPLEALGKGAEEKKRLRLMGQCPVDPALAGVYQVMVTAELAPEPEGEGATPGARMTSKKDPARSEDHGHASGVRRDSASESKS